MRALILAILLAGCAAPKVVLEPVEVKVPVMVMCAVEFSPEPSWAADSLTEQSDIFEIVRALWAERIERQAYEAVIKASAAGCQSKGERK